LVLAEEVIKTIVLVVMPQMAVQHRLGLLDQLHILLHRVVAVGAARMVQSKQVLREQGKAVPVMVAEPSVLRLWVRLDKLIMEG
jgi:hypothetical protein